MVNPEKVEWVEELSESIRENSDLLFTDYKGLTVHEMESLRKELYDNDSYLKVVKNRLAKRAFRDVWSGAEEDEQESTDMEEQAEESAELGDLPGVGPSKVDSLQDHGIESVREVAEAEIDNLTEVSGIGQKTAEKLQGAAQELLPEESGDESETDSSEDEPVEAADPLDAVDGWLNGTTAIAFNGNGFSKTAEILVDFAEEHENMSIKGGILSGQVLESNQVIDISELPSRRELLTSLASALQKPIQKLAFNLNYPLQQLAMSLDQIKDQKEEEE